MLFFDSDSYVTIMKHYIRENAEVRGYQTRLAAAAGCQASYLTNVLRGKCHINLDQASQLAVFWNLNDLSSDYFLALVAFERASTATLRAKFQRDLDHLRRESRIEFRRLADTQEDRVILSPQEAFFYNSQWYISAIHGLLRIAGDWTLERISQRLQLSEELTSWVLKQLEPIGLVEWNAEQGSWRYKKSIQILEAAPTLRKVSHASMRSCANDRILPPNPDNFHVSGFATIRAEDYTRIRADLEKSVMKHLHACSESADEVLVAFCFDFFSL